MIATDFFGATTVIGDGRYLLMMMMMCRMKRTILYLEEQILRNFYKIVKNHIP